MKTIEEQSILLSQNCDGDIFLKYRICMAFRDGAKYVQKWIPVEDDLPETDVPVLVRTKNGKYKVSSMYIPKDCHGNILGEKRWKGSTSFVESITDWRPITYK